MTATDAGGTDVGWREEIVPRPETARAAGRARHRPRHRPAVRRGPRRDARGRGDPDDVLVTDPDPTGLLVGSDGVSRCAWAGSAPEYLAYHDDEWGVPVHGESALFERFTLEAFQSGLSWITILRKRPAFRAAFAGFDAGAGRGLRRRRPGPADGRRRHRPQRPQGRRGGRQRPGGPRPARRRRARRVRLVLRPRGHAVPRGPRRTSAPPARSRSRSPRASSSAASSSWVRRRRMRRCRPAGSSTTTSPAASVPVDR